MNDIDATIFDKYPIDSYVWCAFLTVDTDIVWGGTSKRFLIRHKTSQFIWIDGDKDTFPTLIIPLNEANKDELYEYSKSPIFDDVLDYLSLLSLLTGWAVELRSKTFKNDFGLWRCALDYHSGYPRSNSYHEFRFLQDPPPNFTFALNRQSTVVCGFFREALSSNNIFYSALACNKALEHAFTPSKDDKIKFINDYFDSAKSNYIKKNRALGLGDFTKFDQFVNRHGKSVADYLYNQCRNAIAHAKSGDLFREPCKYSDYYEMYFANEALKAIILYWIEQNCG